MAEVITWLTQEAHDRLAGELQSLIDARPAIAAEINARRERVTFGERRLPGRARDEQAKHEVGSGSCRSAAQRPGQPPAHRGRHGGPAT